VALLFATFDLRPCRGWQPGMACDGRLRPAWSNHHRVASSRPWRWHPPHLGWRCEELQYPGNTASPSCSERGRSTCCC